MIITNAKIYGRSSRSLMDIALEGDAIVAVGPAGSQDTTGHEVMDADSRIVMPGLWDEHVHCGLWAQRRRWIDLSPATSAAEAAAIMGQAVRESSDTTGDAVLIGAGYRDGLWTDRK